MLRRIIGLAVFATALHQRLQHLHTILCEVIAKNGAMVSSTGLACQFCGQVREVDVFQKTTSIQPCDADFVGMLFGSRKHLGTLLSVFAGHYFLNTSRLNNAPNGFTELSTYTEPFKPEKRALYLAYSLKHHIRIVLLKSGSSADAESRCKDLTLDFVLECQTGLLSRLLKGPWLGQDCHCFALCPVSMF